VNFAEGLETQRYRLEDHMDEDALWILIDLIDGMRARETFIQPDETHLHVAASVLDMDAWMPLVPKERPVYFTAQGLFMYLEEEANKKLFQQMADEYPGATLQFDWFAAWLSNQTMKGFKLTKDYTTPKMPFGVNKNNAKFLLESWVPGIEVEEIAWPTENVEGLLRWIMHIFMATPILKNYQPGFVLRVKFPSE
jgi:O-methyltransferase involved in polyketide biosynthesis